MLTRVLGVDIQSIFMTMLGLVGLYLILTRASDVNTLVKTTLGSANKSLVILQGRDPKKVI